MKSRMFHLGRDRPMQTINPIHGCCFDCYDENCWAKKHSKRMQAKGVKGYENGFEPTFCPRFLNKKFKAGEIVAVGLMGDISFFEREVWERIMEELIRPQPKVTFFLETKNPGIFIQHLDIIPENVILSTTIETNRNYKVSKALPPRKRWEAMVTLDWSFKHVSIEPIMDFDLDTLVNWMFKIEPNAVSVGYDNYHNHLPEPPLKETLELIKQLEQFTHVERKTLREANESDGFFEGWDRAIHDMEFKGASR